MPGPIGNVEERDKRFRALSPVIFNVNYNTSMSAGRYDILDDFLPYGWFADQNYVITKASLSFAVHAPFGGDIYAILGWSFDPVFLDFSGSYNYRINQSVIASVVAAYYGSAALGLGGAMPAPCGTSQEFNFQDHPIYLEKGRRVYLCAAAQNACNIVYSATLYLMPTYA
jgi:hypothetical protein